MKIVGVAVAVLALIVALVAGSWAFRYYTAETRGIISGEERIESAASRISRYEEFFGLCAQVQSQKAQLQAQRERLEQTDDPDTVEHVRANVAGLKGQVARTVNTYNARARQSYTSGRFRDSSLPYQLSTEGETTCVN